VTQSAYLFLGLTAVVAALAAVLAYAVLRIFAAARMSTRQERSAGVETAFMAAAMEDAVRKLREGERAMKARAEASERLSSEIVASLTSGLLVVDAGGIIRTLNPAGQAMLGLAHGNWQGPYRDVLKDVSPLADVLEECLRTATPVVRRSVPISIGAVSHLGLTVSPIREDANAPAVDHDDANAQAVHNVHGVICLFSDLTEVMELEEQLRLKDSLARLGEMTAGIAHEFRNGLATIHGYSRLLDLERLEPKYRPYVQGIRDETESLKQVVTNFLNFARPTELILTPSGQPTTFGPTRAPAVATSSFAENSAGSTATRSCFDRRSATCAATPSKPATTLTWFRASRLTPSAMRRTACCASASATTAPASPTRLLRASSVPSSRRKPMAPASASPSSKRSSLLTTAASRS